MKGLVPKLVPQYEEVVEEAGCETRIPGWTGYGHGLFLDVWMPPKKRKGDDKEVSRCLYCGRTRPSSQGTESSVRPIRALSIRSSLDARDVDSTSGKTSTGLWLPGSKRS